MRFLTPVRVKARGVFLALTACLALIVFSGTIALPVSQDQKVNPVSFLNDRVRDIIGATAVNAPGFIVSGGLSGEGQIVAIADSGLDTGRLEDIHPDFRNTPGKMPKIIGLESLTGRAAPDDPDGHGTHMAATIAGTGAASNGEFRGVAPGASLYFQSILNGDGKPQLPDNLNDLFEPAYSAGARIHVDGWGSGTNNYGEASAGIDGFVRSHPDFLVTLGVGNSGPAQGTITTEANSKNALSVGSSILPRPAFVPGADSTLATADFSSRGPAGDGRIKPELLAPGSAVVSARSSLIEGNLEGYPEYTRMQGTSMADAVAGGSAALLREYFVERTKDSDPSAALMKALLINGARPFEGGPSVTGFGIVDLSGTLIALREETFKYTDEQKGIAQGSQKTYSVHIADGNEPFKATLAWTDAPAEPGSTRTLVNDLDLIVVAPDGKTYYGNHFLGNNSPDRLNNVEQVYLETPVPGDYTIRVFGQSIQVNSLTGGERSQDFALAWGQPPAESMVEETSGTLVKLSNGQEFDAAKADIKYLVNDSKVNDSQIYAGTQVFQTARRVYMTVRLWLANGVKMLKFPDKTILTEIDPAARLGGYSLAADAGVTLKKKPIGPEGLPPGVEVTASINPFDQKIRYADADYVEKDGVVLALYSDKNQPTIRLEGEPLRTYKISQDAVYSFSDSYEGSEIADIPFGAGSLEALEKSLPGLPVRLHLAPSTGEVQYMVIQRQVLLGTVAEVTSTPGRIKMENGELHQISPAVRVIKDGVSSRYDQIKQGDKIAAVLLPDTGALIGVVAYSKVLYGEAIGITEKDDTFYLLDDSGQYWSFNLTSNAVFYRWGVKAASDAVSAGNLVKVTTSPDGGEVWRVDIAEQYKAQDTVAGFDLEQGVLATNGGSRYGVSLRTRFYKNGYTVLPEDILPGERVELKYALAPSAGDKVLVSANASSAEMSPLLLASVIPMRDQLSVAGRTDPGCKVSLWIKGRPGQSIPVSEDGQFKFLLPQENGGETVTLVTVNHRTGGVWGVQLTGAPNEPAAPEGDDGQGNEKITRAQTADMLSRFLNWPELNTLPLPFTDSESIPEPTRSAVAEARDKGIFKGYPDGTFRPGAYLSRAEAAVVLAGVLWELGQSVEAVLPLPYLDAGDIPRWAVNAVAETTAAGLFDNLGSLIFSPDLSMTAGEMEAALNHIIEYVVNRLPVRHNS